MEASGGEVDRHHARLMPLSNELVRDVDSGELSRSSRLTAGRCGG